MTVECSSAIYWLWDRRMERGRNGTGLGEGWWREGWRVGWEGVASEQYELFMIAPFRHF